MQPGRSYNITLNASISSRTDPKEGTEQKEQKAEPIGWIKKLKT